MASTRHHGSAWPGKALGVVVALRALAGCDAYEASLLATSSALSTHAAPSAQCGDARLDEPELCDPAIAAGMAGACPSTCDETDPCAPQRLTGSGCEIECATFPITVAREGDGCCPQGVGPGEDGDCGSCGDGIIGPGESCDPPEKCPTREECTQRNACFVALFSGDPERCTARCELSFVRDCMDGDGCCAEGCDAASDDDCSASCGDGLVQVEAGESCEPGDRSAPCTASCNDEDPCTEDLMTGTSSNCNVECANPPITEPLDGDGCCPPGAHALNDEDCSPSCGNLVLERGEICDPCPESCEDDDPCTADVASGDAFTCSAVCIHTPLTLAAAGDMCCPSGANANDDADCAPMCGNAVTEAGEECDGGDLCTAQCSWTDEGRCLSLDTTGAEQTCIQCRCQSCTALMLGCFTNPEPSFTGNCQAVVECGHQAHCSGDACYCGSNSLCFAPNGPCRSAIDRAAADEGQSVQSCSNDSACVLYQTVAIGACVAASCASECGG